MTQEDGFTLVELLAALLAGSLLLAALGYLAGMFGHEVHRTRDNQFAEISATGQLLQSLLSTAVKAPQGGQVIEADAGHLTAYVDPPIARRGMGLMKASLKVTRDGDGAALDLALAKADDETPVDQRRLVHGMRAIEIAVADKTAPALPPRLITLTFTTADRETWEVPVEPRLTGAGGCKFDPISMTCRQ